MTTDNWTVSPCPHGCGGTVAVGRDVRCPSCRRNLNEQEIQPLGTCWAWFGPADHRMRCRKRTGHEPRDRHSTHDDCGYQREDGLICGKEDGHDGPCFSKRPNTIDAGLTPADIPDTEWTADEIAILTSVLREVARRDVARLGGDVDAMELSVSAIAIANGGGANDVFKSAEAAVLAMAPVLLEVRKLRAVVDKLPRCNHAGCGRTATRFAGHYDEPAEDERNYCDEHVDARGRDMYPLPWAAEWRRLEGR